MPKIPNLTTITSLANTDVIPVVDIDTDQTKKITKTNLFGELNNLADAEIQQLENIGATTITATQWGYLGAMSAQPLEDITGEAIGSLSDVTEATPADNELLAYDTTNSDWRNQTPTEAGFAAVATGGAHSDLTGIGSSDHHIKYALTDDLAAGEITQLQAIGATTITATQWGYLGNLDQGLATTDSPTFAGLTIGSSNGIDIEPGSDTDADLITVGVTGAPKLWWDESEDNFIFSKGIDVANGIKLGASDNYAVAGDTSNPTLVLRRARVRIKDGANANTIWCTVSPNWNGDTIAAVDNIGKGATTGDFTLDAAGSLLTIEASGLTGNVIMVHANVTYDSSGSVDHTWTYASGNDIVMKAATGGGGFLDWTAVVDTNKEINIAILYITDQ